MSIKMRVRHLERRLGRNLVPTLPRPHLITVYIHSEASPFNPDLIRWGTIPGIPTLFERRPEESEDDFISRVAKHAPRTETPFASTGEIRIYAEGSKPETSEMPSEATFLALGKTY
jgi:hypothetical protein